MKTGKLKTTPHCPSCNATLSGFSTAEGEHVPTPGDISVCVYCYEILEFTDSLGLQLVSADNLALCDFTQLQQINRVVRELQAERYEEPRPTNGQKPSK